MTQLGSGGNRLWCPRTGKFCSVRGQLCVVLGLCPYSGWPGLGSCNTWEEMGKGANWDERRSG